MYENIFTRANICCYGDNLALRRKKCNCADNNNDCGITQQKRSAHNISRLCIVSR
jgi:hypothetical protein